MSDMSITYKIETKSKRAKNFGHWVTCTDDELDENIAYAHEAGWEYRITPVVVVDNPAHVLDYAFEDDGFNLDNTFIKWDSTRGLIVLNFPCGDEATFTIDGFQKMLNATGLKATLKVDK